MTLLESSYQLGSPAVASNFSLMQKKKEEERKKPVASFPFYFRFSPRQHEKKEIQKLMGRRTISRISKTTIEKSQACMLLPLSSPLRPPHQSHFHGRFHIPCGTYDAAMRDMCFPSSPRSGEKGEREGRRKTQRPTFCFRAKKVQTDGGRKEDAEDPPLGQRRFALKRGKNAF